MDCEDADGPEVKIRCLIEIRYAATWSTIFDGLIDVSQKEELSLANRFYKYAAPIIRNDFWATFMNRRTVKVDLQASVDLEGNARTAVNKITLPLPGQLITKQFLGQLQDATIFGAWSHYYTLASAEFGAIDFPVIYKNEIDGKNSIIREDLAVAPSNLFTIPEDGEYVITSEIFIASAASLPSSQVQDVEYYIQINSDTPIAFTKTQQGTDPASGRTKFDYTDTLTLVKGDEVRFYFENTAGTARNFYWSNQYYSFLTVVSTTSYIDTDTDAYLIKDAFESVLSKIIGQNSVIESTMFTTCKRLNAVFRGIHGRGFSFADKPFTTSFDELWKGFEPVANIGLGYTEVAGVKKIQIENKSFFYGQTPSVFLSNVSGLTRRYDLEKHYKTIEVGYSKRFIEAAGGVDDPQTLASWRTKFRTIGNDLKIISTFFLASLGIEQNRRNRVELNKDGKIDEDIIMVSVKSDGGSGYTPEVGTDFNAITDLLNSDTRYNIRHTCARVFKRWQSFIQGCLQHTTSEYFYYSGGEGNRVMSSQFETTDCEATDDPEPVLVEDADIAVSTTDYLFIPKVFKCKVPMSKVTYDAILADKENAIAISQDSTTYIPMHILDFDYKIFGGYADLLLLQASASTVIPGSDVILQEDGNAILMEDGSSNILLE